MRREAFVDQLLLYVQNSNDAAMPIAKNKMDESSTGG
jgi:hypothetical protein